VARPRRRSKSLRESGCEWIGGRLSPPFFVTDREEPFRAELVVWMELPGGLVLAQDVHAPEDSQGALGRVLRAALERPLVGPPRRPAGIRVADASLAEEVRAVVGGAIRVEIAATPELDEFLDVLVDSLPAGAREQEEASYLESGRVPATAVEQLFRSADLLYRLAPWKTATDDQVLRIDIPSLGVRGACVSIIGNLGESLGLLLFPSLAGYHAFADVAEGLRPDRGRLDFGTSVLCLNFDRGAEIPASMRREVAAHGWPVANANAYPLVEHRDRDGACRPLVERDVRIASACALSLVSFFARRGHVFEAVDPEPVSESYTDDDGLTVRFTFPYQACALFEDEEAPARARVVGRNDPCPCGSGKKYKKCHLAPDEAERSPASGRSPVHDLDDRLVAALRRFAFENFGLEWHRFEEDFADAAATAQLSIPWSLFCYRVRGETIVDLYLEERGRRLAATERAWLEAQRAAWLSAWEVEGVEPGTSVTLRDLLTHEVRRVREESGSRTLVVRDAVLARVVDHAGESLLCGMHPRALPPRDADDLVRRARGRLRRKGAVPVERLRDEGFGRYLIRRWEEAVAGADARARILPELRNRDGDAFLLTVDHFHLAKGARAEVASRLAALEGVSPPEPGDEAAEYAFLRQDDPMGGPGSNTLVGLARLTAASLRLETSSRERADELRRRVEDACRGLVSHRAREHADPLSQALAADARPLPPPPPEAEQMIREIKERHYATWSDVSLPALGGKSPREAMRTAQGRDAVDLLLKEMENHERRFEGEAGFDFSRLRRELGLD
jgi:hypothetical protein